MYTQKQSKNLLTMNDLCLSNPSNPEIPQTGKTKYFFLNLIN
jgi:hypothetical protein